MGTVFCIWCRITAVFREGKNSCTTPFRNDKPATGVQHIVVWEEMRKTGEAARGLLWHEDKKISSRSHRSKRDNQGTPTELDDEDSWEVRAEVR